MSDYRITECNHVAGVFLCTTCQQENRINELEAENKWLRAALEGLLEWNAEYPSKLVYVPSEIKAISEELDDKMNIAKQALKKGGEDES